MDKIIKISYWQDLIDKEFNNGLGLIARVENPNYDALVCNIYTVEDKNDPIAIIDWMSGDTPEETIGMLKKFGFKIEYKKPFGLIGFLKENLKPISYMEDIEIYCFQMVSQTPYLMGSVNLNPLGCKFFDIVNENGNNSLINNELIYNQVTKEQLIQALKELGWI